MQILTRDFYNRKTITVAKDLLGKILVREYDNNRIIGLITETEAYCGIKDKACHTYGSRRTERTETMYGESGHAYVYMTYGMYYCLNAVTEEINNPCAVLIRGIKIIEGIEIVAKNRYNIDYEYLSKYQIENISNGPGKLCRAMNIDKRLNGIDLTGGNQLYICEPFENKKYTISKSKRVGIDYAEEYKDKLWRFVIQ